MRGKDIARRGIALSTALMLGACGSLSSIKDTFLGGSNAANGPERLTGFIGAVVADEPRAALAGREVLITGGNAADAAAAAILTLAVTLPSRASLGGGGACLAFNPSREGPGAGRPEAIVFTPIPAQAAGAGADRPAAVPMLARGVFALQARYGKLPFEGLVAPAEQLARFGVPTSRTLAQDLALVAGPLVADPNARAVFAPGGVPLTEGATLSQPDLGATLSTLRTQGVGDLYQGALARRFEVASRVAGGPVTLAELRAALPRSGAPITLSAGRDLVAFLPPPADGGLAAAAGFRAAQAGDGRAGGDVQAAALGAASRWRAGGATVEAALAGGGGGSLGAMGASTSIAVLDREGNAVTCALTMNNLFGTGRIAPGTGILLAASPRTAGLPLLAAAIAWNENLHAFRAVVGGSGQEGAPAAVAIGMSNALRGTAAMPAPVPSPGRANAIACSRYLPGSETSCSWAADPRGSGLAASSN